eukprot:m.225362 g.225362  ORF g.225362 m.225362 type:complete len:492 (-) comp19205_c0_seq2:500-1975(-)
MEPERKFEDSMPPKVDEHTAPSPEALGLVQRIRYAQAVNVFCWLFMIPARPEMVLHAMKGDAARAAQTLATLTANASAMEFIAMPILGRLSDLIGRRPLLVGGPIICSLMRLLTYLNADKGSRGIVRANLIDRAISGSIFPMFMTVSNAAITDIISGEKNLASAFASGAALLGIAVAISPACAALLMRLTGDPKSVALVVAGVSLANAVQVFCTLPETMPPNRSKPFRLTECTPWAFTRFFVQSDNALSDSRTVAHAGTSRDGRSTACKGDTNTDGVGATAMTSTPRTGPRAAAGPSAPPVARAVGATMRALSTALLCMGFPSDMHDTRMVFLKTNLGLDTAGIAHYMLGVGASVMAQGVLAKKLLTACGGAVFTHVSVAAAVSALLAWGLATRPAAVGLALSLESIGNSRTHYIVAVLTELAIRRGMGKGEIAAAISSMSTLTKILAPVVFARLYAKFGQRAPFLLGAVVLAVGDFCFTHRAHPVKEKTL